MFRSRLVGAHSWCRHSPLERFSPPKSTPKTSDETTTTRWMQAVSAMLWCSSIERTLGGRFPMSQSKGPRFSKVERGDLNEQQKRVAERIMKVSSAGLGGPYIILLRSPVLAARYLGMTDYLRFETSLPHRLNELAI